jgi:histone H3/H4
VTALYGKARMADRIPQLANVVISNVPGPPLTLYMAGAKMLTNYPTSIIMHGMALNITVQSYDKSLDFGLMADAAAMPDVRELADAIAIAFDDLRALPRPGEADSDEALPDGPVARTARQLGDRVARAVTGAVSTAMKGAVKGAVTGAVKQALGQVTRSAAAAVPKATRKRVAEPRATAPVRRRKAG